MMGMRGFRNFVPKDTFRAILFAEPFFRETRLRFVFGGRGEF
jgi:hypothetical protein